MTYFLTFNNTPEVKHPLCLFVTITAVTCLALPTWAGMLVNSTNTDYRAAVNYSCDGASLLTDSRSWGVASCEGTGIWTPAVVTCQGKNSDFGGFMSVTSFD